MKSGEIDSNFIYPLTYYIQVNDIQFIKLNQLFSYKLIREREERERKKRVLRAELDRCIQLQNQWKTIQKLIEMEEDRLIEECQVQRRRLSQMQQQERKEKAEKLAMIRVKLQKALEVEEVTNKIHKCPN